VFFGICLPIREVGVCPVVGLAVTGAFGVLLGRGAVVVLSHFLVAELNASAIG
jgi:hypothetical protein